MESSPLAAANSLLAFALEVAMLWAFGFWAFWAAPAGPVRYLAAAAIVVVAVALWAVWAAPRSPRRLDMPWLLVFKAVLFGAATLALFAASQPFWGGIFGVLAMAHLVAVAVLERGGRP